MLHTPLMCDGSNARSLSTMLEAESTRMIHVLSPTRSLPMDQGEQLPTHPPSVSHALPTYRRVACLARRFRTIVNEYVDHAPR